MSIFREGILQQQHHFLQLVVRVTDEMREPVSNFLFENGAQGIVEGTNELLAYFPETRDEAQILPPLFAFLNSLRDLLDADFDIVVSTEKIAARDWNAEWKSTWRAIRVTDNILIKPSWEEMPDPAPPVVIEIDPEMAFGSGENATTRLTLQLIEKNIQPGMRVLDIGTGTGVLAIGAAKLGAGFVLAFDNDPLAAETAQRNAAKNGVADRVKIFTGTLDAVAEEKFHLIAANVNRTQIIAMLPRMRDLLAPGGCCLLSGILDVEEKLVKAACAENSLRIDTLLREQEWLAFEIRKR